MWHLETQAVRYASANMAKEHFDEVSGRRIQQVEKIEGAVRTRLISSINYWNNRAIELGNEFKAGRQPCMQPENARRTAQELTDRLEKRLTELARMKNVVSNTPVVMGGILVIPQGMLNQAGGVGTFPVDPAARSHVEHLAMEAVMAAERGFGYRVEDVSAQKCGWDVTSYPPRQAPDKPIPEARHIEVKGRVKGAESVTLTCNEICSAVNQKDKFILALVFVDGNQTDGPYYIRNIANHELDWAQDKVSYPIKELLSKAVKPEETV